MESDKGLSRRVVPYFLVSSMRGCTHRRHPFLCHPCSSSSLSICSPASSPLLWCLTRSSWNISSCLSASEVNLAIEMSRTHTCLFLSPVVCLRDTLPLPSFSLLESSRHLSFGSWKALLSWVVVHTRLIPLQAHLLIYASLALLSFRGLELILFPDWLLHQASLLQMVR